jgi:hypothetical protein
MHRTRFASYNDKGEVQDGFVIKKLNNQRLELSSPQKLQDHDYYILYYFDRVEEAEADTLREQLGM